MLREIFSNVSDKEMIRFDLLDLEVEERLAQNPGLLAAEVSFKKPLWVIVDEIQKLPALLNTVHSMIEDLDMQSTKFALNGSSARKLKKSGVNLLAVRAFVYHLFPLTHLELGGDFDLKAALEWGT